MSGLARVGFAILVTGAIVSIAELMLALSGSHLAPSWLQSFIPMFASFGGAFLVFIGDSRRLREVQTNIRIEWRTDDAVPADAALERRRSLQPKPAPPIASIFMTMAILFATMLVMTSYPAAREWGALRQRGVETTGTVTKKRSTERTLIASYSIVYDFEYRLQTITDHAQISKSEWRRLQTGSKVPVTFIESAPHISVPLRRADMSWPATLDRVFDVGMFLILACFGVVTSAMVIVARSMLRGNRGLMQRGAAAIATVTRVKGMAFSCSYDVDGRTFNREFFFRSASLPRPSAGDRFVILYDESSPRRSVPWPIARSQFESPNEIAAPADSIAQSLSPPVISERPAPVRLSWQVPLVLIVSVLFSAPFIVRYMTSRDVRARINRVRESGRETEGTVVDAAATQSRHLDRLTVQYRYAVNGRTYEQSYTESTLRRRDRFTPGAKIVVTYAARSPEISVPLSKRDLEHALTTTRADIGLALTVAIVIGVAFIWMVRRTVVEWKFARNGHVAIAIVKKVEGSILRRMRYRFMTTHGDFEQTSRLQSKHFSPAIGERISVLYLEHPLRSMPAADLVFVKRGDGTT